MKAIRFTAGCLLFIVGITVIVYVMVNIAAILYTGGLGLPLVLLVNFIIGLVLHYTGVLNLLGEGVRIVMGEENLD